MPSIDAGKTGQAYWRSLDELADTPEFRAFVEREFPNNATEFLQTSSRRTFLKIMGASFGLAGLTSCRWPKETIVPYARRPDNRTDGVPVQYATAMEIGGVAAGLLVTSFDGRPVKIEGNAAHPINRGATDAISQAAVLELYDPDRSRVVVRREGREPINQAWADFETFAREHFGSLRTSGGAGLCVLSELSSSPSLADMRARVLRAFPQARWHEYEPINRDCERAGAAIAFGKPYRTQLALDKADVIVCLDADILMSHPAAIRHTRDFAASRDTADTGRMSRLYVFESTYTVTGSMADHRAAVRSSDIAGVLAALTAQLAKLGVGVPAAAGQVKSPLVELLARDLVSHKGRSVLVAGPSQPPQVHALVHAINAALGNVGNAVAYVAEPDADRPACLDSVRALAGDLRDGKVKTLVILGGNPVFDAPADLEFGKLLAAVPARVHLSLYDNETSQACNWHVPRAHFLESWGDARAWDGTLCATQPLIDPLYEGRTPIELLAIMLNEDPRSGHEIVQRTAKQYLPEAGFDAAWQTLLHEGVLAGSAFKAETPAVRADAVAKAAGELGSSAKGGVELVFTPDAKVYDGRFANNGWLQEMPDPLTKIVWDNMARIAPATAQKLGIKHGDMIAVDVGGRTLEIAAYFLPGQAQDSIAVSLGYGRTAAGRVGNGVGFNTYAIRTSVAMGVAAGATIKATGKTYSLVSTQDHYAIDKVGLEERERRVGRPGEVGEVYREGTLEHYKQHPEFASHEAHELPDSQLWQSPVSYDGHKWGMAIDLNKCTGCAACTLACQAENNIPVVGKDQVNRGREMHWIRVDRYFSGNVDEPQAVHQPLACVHCENAPCEQVCPVAATVHDTEGLNVMVYNRCVGTRYCSNNCPYKVRRFNWFHWQGNVDETARMAFNPEVTVRSRGVMEKCTFCTQRIQAVKIRAKNERRPIGDGEIVTACAQACPARAIVFGDLNDPNSEVAKLHARNRSYKMLAELNVRPRTAYLAKIRNPGEPAAGGGQHEHAAG